MPGGAWEAARRLAWREPDGRVTRLNVPAHPFETVRVSPEGRRAVAVLARTRSADLSLWLIDLVRETMIRLTPAGLAAQSPVWHPREPVVVFGVWNVAVPVERRGLYRVSTTGTGAPELFLMRVTFDAPTDASPLLASPSQELSPALSPDGKWLAYVLVENGPEVFVRPYPEINAARIPVSNGVGQNPVWSHDGRQLYFSTPTDAFVVDVEPGQPIAFGKPRRVTALRDDLNEPVRISLPPVGGRILTIVRDAPSATRPAEYRVVLNWTEELKSRVGDR
jgi:hypothetical protein